MKTNGTVSIHGSEAKSGLTTERNIEAKDTTSEVAESVVKLFRSLPNVILLKLADTGNYTINYETHTCEIV
jgi:hypothetical protein